MLNQSSRKQKKTFRAKKNPNSEIKTLDVTDWSPLNRYTFSQSRKGLTVNVTTRTIYVWDQTRTWQVSDNINRIWKKRTHGKSRSDEVFIKNQRPDHATASHYLGKKSADLIDQFHNIKNIKSSENQLDELQQLASIDDSPIICNYSRPKNFNILSFKKRNGQLYNVTRSGKGAKKKSKLYNNTWGALPCLYNDFIIKNLDTGFRHAALLLFGTADCSKVIKNLRPGLFDRRAGYIGAVPNIPKFLRAFINEEDSYAAMGKYFGTASNAAFIAVAAIFIAHRHTPNNGYLNLLYGPYVARRHITAQEMDYVLTYMAQNMHEYHPSYRKESPLFEYREDRKDVKKISSAEIIDSLTSSAIKELV